jgi:hypothetical protein
VRQAQAKLYRLVLSIGTSTGADSRFCCKRRLRYGSHGLVCLAFEPFQWGHMICGYLRTLANTQCIQDTHCAQDDKHQYEAIKENHNEDAKDHGFKATCTHVGTSRLRLAAIPFRETRPVYWSTVDAHRKILMRIVQSCHGSRASGIACSDKSRTSDSSFEKTFKQRAFSRIHGVLCPEQ